MNCTICNKPIALNERAMEMAMASGISPVYFGNLYRQHTECLIKKPDDVAMVGDDNSEEN